MSRKPNAIDIVKLAAKSSAKDWNIFLTNCYRKKDMNRLAQARAQLQAGMAKAAKEKLNTEKLQILFIRLQNSIENTMKKIIREKYPNPCDNPLDAINHPDALALKRRRDHELERWLKKTSY